MLPGYYGELLARLEAVGIRRHITLNTGDYESTSELVTNGEPFSINTGTGKRNAQASRREHSGATFR